MAKLSNRHTAFLLQKSLNKFIATTNRRIILRNKFPDHFTSETVDQVTGSFSPDFTSFSITATTVLSTYTRPYAPDSKEEGINRTVELFKKNDWYKSLPEMLASAYKLDIASLPTAETVAVEEDKINTRYTVTHSIVFKARNANCVENVVNAYFAAEIKKPTYFKTIQVRGVQLKTMAVDNEVSIVPDGNFPRSYVTKGDQRNSSIPLMSMVFNYRFMDFSTINYVHTSGLLYTTDQLEDEVKLNFNFHTVIEAEIEANGRTKFISVNINEPIIEADNRFFWEDIDMIDLLSIRATQADIKKLLKSKAVEGTKINWVKTNGLKINNVAVSNTFKYNKMTFIGSLMGHYLIVEIGKRGAVKITNLFGLDLALFDINKAEQITKTITHNLGDLFSNDRAYASSLFYSIMPKMDVKETTILFS
ncbi:hypothetical protein MUB04_15755 [Acinetobacter indicus]|uniref:hypothetical protein n=1 Tax=Acinetobacter TaxID=469 RepID=UPI0015D3954A|nr:MULTISPECIES: hypothetical protein [Acinetobacter]MCP0917993.1 hypothetical protein [Acinetobacter indicus]